MLYYLSYRVYGLNVAHYITFRTAAASLTAFAISLLLGPWLIQRLRAFRWARSARRPATHLRRPAPTMGGLLILAGVLGPTLLWADLSNAFVWIAMLSMAGFGAVGYADDYLKVTDLTTACSPGKVRVADRGQYPSARADAARPPRDRALQHAVDLFPSSRAGFPTSGGGKCRSRCWSSSACRTP
jgi:hypothetical protein